MVGALLTLASAYWAAAPPVDAAPILLEGIAAQVGEEIVLESELAEQLAVARLRYGVADSLLAKAREDILARAIDEQVLVQEARARGVAASPQEISMAVDRLLETLRQQYGSEENLRAEMEREGVTDDELRERYRAQAENEILYSRLLQREIYSKIEVTDADVEDYYREHRDEIPDKQEAVRLAHVFASVRPEEEVIDRAQGKLDQVRSALDEGQDFAAVARQYSDDPGASQFGGDLGWLERGQIDPRIEEVLFGLEVGEVSEPFQTPLGIQILKVTDRGDDGSKVRASHILVLLAPGRSDIARAKAKIDKVAGLAKAGTDFADLAATYSDDTESAEKGGDLGHFAVEELVPVIAEAVDGIGVGETSEVIETDQGYHVFKVTERQAGGRVTLEEIRDQLRNLILEERAAQDVETWLTKIRSNYYIRRATADPLAQAGPAPTVISRPVALDQAAAPAPSTANETSEEDE